jgi:hypothetical protein
MKELVGYMYHKTLSPTAKLFKYFPVGDIVLLLK